MNIAAVVLTGAIAALAAPLFFRRHARAAPLLLSLLVFILFIYLCTWTGSLREAPRVRSYAWVPSVDIHLSFLIDGLSLLFGLLITGIGGFVFIFARDYMHQGPHVVRLYAFMLLFMSAMLGLVFADNIIALYLFWELTTISSFLLIGHHDEKKEARRAAVQAFIVTNAGGLAMLAGLILLAQAGGSYELSHLLDRSDALQGHALQVPIICLLLAGAFTKSAQFPFHFWLPNAMQAPTPVSAYLHSATMVNGGVYLIARLHPIMGGVWFWETLVIVTGAVSLLIGGYMALIQRDIKRMLAYSTISVLGMLIMLLGIGSEKALEAAIIYLFVHALYKAALFLCAGAIDHETGTRDITLMTGLGRIMPLIAIAAGAAALSKSGLPPTLGFIGKEAIFEAGLRASEATVVASAVAGSMFLAAVSWLAGLRPFFGVRDPRHAPADHRMPLGLWLGPLVLGLGGLFWGLFPGTIEENVLAPAVSAAAGRPVTLHLALWHGFNLPLLISVVALAGGLSFYFAAPFLRRVADRFRGMVVHLGPDHLYDRSLAFLEGLARFQTRHLQSGHLRRYLLIVFIVCVALVLFHLVQPGDIRLQLPESSIVHGVALVFCALVVGAIVLVLRSHSLLAAVIALGVIGYGMALIFVLFSAPDLALTQILVETVTLVMFVLIIYRLPQLKRISKPLVRASDAAVALGVGAMMTLLTLKANALELGERISTYFADHSADLAHGKNVVNVILVDFRSLDTLGEITVLAITAIGVWTLIKVKVSEEG
jgi:multicomponent Na+:H+ antiporter subunit A